MSQIETVELTLIHGLIRQILRLEKRVKVLEKSAGIVEPPVGYQPVGTGKPAAPPPKKP